MLKELKLIDSEPCKFLKLPEEERKKIAPYVINMWRFGASNKDSIILTNATLNRLLFSVKSRKMQERLMLVSGVSNTNYKWIKPLAKPKKTSIIQYICTYTGCSPEQAAEYQSKMSDSEIQELLELFGEETKVGKK